MSESSSRTAQALAWQAARLGEELIAAARAGQEALVQKMLWSEGAAARLFEMFGLAWLRLDLRLDDPRESGQLAPYDFQLEGDIGLLELGVLTNVETKDGERGHLYRLFGSGLLLQWAEVAQHWQIVEVFPVNADGQLQSDDPTDRAILDFHQGHTALPFQTGRLQPTENLFLGRMSATGRFNLEEQLNARRLWQAWRQTVPEPVNEANRAEASAIEYLITLFDYHQADQDEIAARYEVAADELTDAAREITAALGVTQFDDRYSVHPDPIAHYRELFGELGIDPRRDEQIRQAASRPIFDSIEVPPDDDTFFGPG